MSEVFVNQCGLRWLPLQDGGGRVLASPDLETSTSGLLVLITGTNSVRAGVWGSTLCVTDSVEHGTAKPLVRWALGTLGCISDWLARPAASFGDVIRKFSILRT